MRNKKGISLIVLVITIIVMIILAAAVVISLNNTGVINKASHAVELTNEKQVQDMAALVWAECYLDPDKRENIETSVKAELEKQGITEDKWNITVTNTGVTVTNKNPNETPADFVYVYSNGSWSEKLTGDGATQGDVIAKFTKTGNKVTPKAITIVNNVETPIILPAGDEYVMEVECNSEIGPLYNPVDDTYSAWIKESIDCMNGTATTCVIPYVTSVTIKGNITKIPEGMFYGASSLETIVLPDSVKEIGSLAFMSCKSLKNITWPANLETIESYSLCATGLEEINLPSKVKTIGAEAFSANYSLKKITLPSSLTTLGIQAFLECSSLTTVVILSESFLEISSDVFTDISPAATITVQNEMVKQMLIDNLAVSGTTNIVVAK